MKTIFLVILFFILSIITFSQSNYQDVVHLKNGDMVKGIIIENVPNNYIKIELLGGSILTYSYQEIEKFAKEKTNLSNQKSSSTPTNIIMQQQQKSVSPPDQSTNIAQTNQQKLAMYNNQKKNPGTAGVLSFLISSTGHAYAGNWGRGLLFLGGRILCVSVASNAESKDHAIGGLIAFLGLAIWEIIDAGNEVDKYNKRLYNSIMHGVPNFGVNISPMHSLCNIPINDGVQLNITYEF